MEPTLIISADFREPDLRELRVLVRSLAKALHGLPVIIKVNSVLRALGYSLIDELHGRGLRVFADLKVVDIRNTLETDGVLLAAHRPEMLTVSCAAEQEGMRVLASLLPETKVLAFTIPSSVTEADAESVYRGVTLAEATRTLLWRASGAGLTGCVLPPQLIAEVKPADMRMDTIVGVGIRPYAQPVKHDDQQNTVSLLKARELGATHYVVGRPVIETRGRWRNAVKSLLKELEG